MSCYYEGSYDDHSNSQRTQTGEDKAEEIDEAPSLPSQQPTPKKTCIAQHPHLAAVGSNQLSMAKGEKLTVLEENLPGGWTRVKNNKGEEGIVLTNYVKIGSGSRLKKPAPAPPTGDNSHVPTSNENKALQKKETYQALSDDEADSYGELDIEEGDKLKVVKGSMDRICVKNSSGNKGKVPTNYLEQAGNEAEQEKIKELESENKSQKQKIKTQENEINNLKSKIIHLESEKIEKQRNIENLEIEEKNENIMDLKSENNEKQRNTESLEIEEKDEHIMDLKSENNEKQTHIEHLEIDEKNEHIMDFKSENNEKQRNTESLEIEEKNERIMHMKSENNEKQSNIESLENKLDDLEEKNRVKALLCNIKPPPKQVESTHRQIVKKIKEVFLAEGYELLHDDKGPTLVTVVNASRTQSDVERDMRAAKLTGSETSNVVLLRIIPVKRSNQKVEKIKGNSFHTDLTFFSDQSRGNFIECQHNTEQCEELFKYLVE